MSTNPFRRSSFRGINTTSPTDTAPIDIPDVTGTTTPPLMLKTRVPSSTQKHVVFASPPGTAIPPVSYPPSPESTKISPAFHISQPVPPNLTNYASLFQDSSFQQIALTNEGNVPISQVPENVGRNTAVADSPLPAMKEDAVRNTLSKFASPSRTPSSSIARQSVGPEMADTAERAAIDVDAFKRLLLTGNSGRAEPRADTSHISAQPQPIASESSSSADTASISQRSLFDALLPTTDDTPRTSHELDSFEVESTRHTTTNERQEARIKPPAPPRPRHGRPIRGDESAIAAEADLVPNPERSVSISTQSTPGKRPPTPPLTRRQSQKGGPRNPSQSRLPTADIEAVSMSSIGSSRAPPPPPSRRPESMVERKLSVELSSTAEEPDGSDGSLPPSRKSSGSRAPPPLPPARTASSNKRISLSAISPPPVPPPRRNRGSSKSSIDGHRPSMSVIMGASGNNESARSSSEFAGSDGGIRTTSGTINSANDILANLAALQREVDQARRQGDT